MACPPCHSLSYPLSHLAPSSFGGVLVLRDRCLLHGDFSIHEQDLIAQLQLHKMHTCHTIRLDTARLHLSVELTLGQIRQLRQLDSNLLMLHCLHVMGKQRFPSQTAELKAFLSAPSPGMSPC